MNEKHFRPLVSAAFLGAFCINCAFAGGPLTHLTYTQTMQPMPLVAPVQSIAPVGATVGATAPFGAIAPVRSTVHLEPLGMGATNGTIGPQGSDATFVTGVNTAGTLRVNNLANLEAMLNIIASCGQILGLGFGLGLGAAALINLESAQRFMCTKTLGRKSMIALAAVAIFAGLSFPGLINWLVTSARDANLFS